MRTNQRPRWMRTQDQKALIFCRTKQRAERLAQTLEEDGFKALPIHKGLTVTQRRNAIQMFRDGEVQVPLPPPLEAYPYS